MFGHHVHLIKLFIYHDLINDPFGSVSFHQKKAKYIYEFCDVEYYNNCTFSRNKIYYSNTTVITDFV
jgi:hypothetical protein